MTSCNDVIVMQEGLKGENSLCSCLKKAFSTQERKRMSGKKHKEQLALVLSKEDAQKTARFFVREIWRRTHCSEKNALARDDSLYPSLDSDRTGSDISFPRSASFHLDVHATELELGTAQQSFVFLFGFVRGPFSFYVLLRSSSRTLSFSPEERRTGTERKNSSFPKGFYGCSLGEMGSR